MSDWASPWHAARQRALDAYGEHLGRPAADLVTPALVADLDALDRNIAAMAAALRGGPARLRPHTKVQKSPDLAHRQLAAGAVGVTVATVWEAAALAAAGIDDILIANEVVGRQKVRAAATLARHARLTVVVDSPDNIAALCAAVVDAGTELAVLVDLDVGMGRCGARSPRAASDLASIVAASPGLTLTGIQAYEGHCMHEPDPRERARLATAAIDQAAAVAETLRQRFPGATTLSSGGTGTYAITGHHPAVTELQAGSYVFMDAFHGRLVDAFEVSLTVLTTVLARHDDTVILDAGRKSIGIDFVSPPIAGYGYEARYYAEEHALFDVDDRLPARPGDQLSLIPGYAPTTVNLHDVIFATRAGTVEEVWPVFPRGASHHGFLGALGLGVR